MSTIFGGRSFSHRILYFFFLAMFTNRYKLIKEVAMFSCHLLRLIRVLDLELKDF